MSKKNRNRPPYAPSGNNSNSQTAASVSEEFAQSRSMIEALELEKLALQQQLQPYLDVLGKAEREAQDLIDCVKQDEARLRAESRQEQERELEQLKASAREDAERTRAVAQGDVAELLQSTEGEASAIRESARQVLTEATQQAQRIVDEANDQVRVRREALEVEIVARVEEAETQLKLDQAEVDRRTRALADCEKAARLEEQRLRVLREDVEFDLEGVQLRRAELEKRWKECSPDRIWIVERDLDSERRKTASLSAVVTNLQTQCERFRRDQENLAGKSATLLLSELESLRARNQEMADRLASSLSAHEIGALRADAAELRIMREQRDELDRQLRAQTEASTRLDLGLRELNQSKIQADALRILNDELQKQIELSSKALTQRTGACFPELLRIDTSDRHPRASGDRLTATEGRFLSMLVSHVRSYAASAKEKPLYYSEMDMRTFLAGLATAPPFMILQGLSGTGKTSLPRVFAESIGAEHRKISVQSNWRDRHELLGYYNDFNKRFTETEFTQALYTASLPSEEEVPWFIVLDEVNLARVEYYFADFLSVLEDQDRARWVVELMSFDPTTEGAKGPAYLFQNRMIWIPGNLWFIGTANQDESTFEITDKVYDRAQVIDFRERHAPNGLGGTVTPRRVILGDLIAAFDAAKKAPQNRLTKADEAFLTRLDNFLISTFDVTFGNRVLDQIRSFVPVYVGCGGKKSEGFDIQFTRKILRKLGNLHDPAAKQRLDSLSDELRNTPPGWEPLAVSLKALERIAK